MRVRAKIKNGEIMFSSAPSKRAFFERTEGKDIIIDVDDEPTTNMRGYFEGAVVPAVFYQHPKSAWIDFSDAREALKLEFIPRFTQDFKGNRHKIARSTADLSKEKFGGFLETITRWMQENGLEVPDTDEYKAWRDSAPALGEIYPPLARMKIGYDKAKVTSVAPWHNERKKKG